jgi:tyrosinase
LINSLDMKTKYIACLYIAILLLVTNNASAQRIRKDHREMTPSEKTAYVNALIVLRNNGTLTMIADHHASHFTTAIHSTSTTNGEFFLPWHRIFAVEMENYIRGTSAAASTLCVPYWDWRLENTAANVTWDDAGFLQLSTLNSGSYTVTRSLGTTNTLATPTDVTNMLAIPSLMSSPPAIGLKSSSVNFLTYRMEFWHDRGHNFIGGTMGGSTSPRDPIFFLHHNFVDKLWQEWFDSDNGVAKTDYTFTAPSSSYWMWPGITANAVKDSRYMKFQDGMSAPVTQEEVWYAYNSKLVLDGVNGAAFNVTGTNRLYCYTAWNGTALKGEIFAGDVKRNVSDNIVADNRGGIKIKSGATCTFSTSSAITLLPGFESEYGAVFQTNLVSLPCGFNALRPEAGDEVTDIDNIQILNTDTQLYVYSEFGSNNLQINYTLGADSRVTIQLFNMMGQMVYSAGMGERPPGAHQNNISIQLANGVYFCKLITDNHQQAVKFVY